jgi:hypothetical protein
MARLRSSTPSHFGPAPTGVIAEGTQIQLGADEHYAPVCWGRYDEATRDLAQEHSGAVLRPS